MSSLTPEQAANQFLQVAQYEKEAVIPFRFDAYIAQHNVLRGLEAVLPHEHRIEEELPYVDVDQIRELRPLTHAVVFAVNRVNRTKDASVLQDLMPEAFALRRKMLSSAHALREAGLLPEREVLPIQEGHGVVDSAGDLPQLSSLFRRHAGAIQGKHPISEDDLARADSLGTRLLEILQPGGAASTPLTNEKLEAAVDARDRLWTLLTKRYELLWKVGAWLFGYEVDDKLPRLQSRKLKREEAKAEEPTTDPEEPVES
ncbi:MAG: hypothetical protein ACOC1F_14385 [Myxococcota bacterium]